MSAQNIDLRNQYITSISLYAGLGADELLLYNLNSQQLLDYYRNDLDKATQPSFWNAIYPALLITNSAIEGLTSSNSLTSSVKQQLMGEARFMRAFYYFYLVNMYGKVPLVVSTNYLENSRLGRSSVEDVYKLIISDLLEAQNLLSDKYRRGDAMTEYPFGMEERVRPTKWAATALLARVYLYNNDWVNSEKQATKVIENVSQFILEDINKTFSKNNKEAIWQLQSVGNESRSNTGEGRIFVLPTNGPDNFNNPVYLDSSLVSKFDSTDLRRSKWINKAVVGTNTFYYPYKYKVGNIISPSAEYSTIFRLGEQYLIRAEARARQNNLNAAIADINSIRIRSGLSALPLLDLQLTIDEIMLQRRLELFTEWGHRWFDLKRTNSLDLVMQNATLRKGGTWQSYQSYYPVPQYDLDKNSNLNQNLGY